MGGGGESGGGGETVEGETVEKERVEGMGGGGECGGGGEMVEEETVEEESVEGGRRDGGEGESEGGRDCGADKMCVLTMLTSLLSASVSFVESISHCLRASNICKYMYIVQIIYTFIICTHNIHIMY